MTFRKIVSAILTAAMVLSFAGTSATAETTYTLGGVAHVQDQGDTGAIWNAETGELTLGEVLREDSRRSTSLLRTTQVTAARSSTAYTSRISDGPSGFLQEPMPELPDRASVSKVSRSVLQAILQLITTLSTELTSRITEMHRAGLPTAHSQAPRANPRESKRSR